MSSWVLKNRYYLLILSVLTTYLSFAISGWEEEVMMPGPTTHGHYQIEMQCSVCHTEWMGVKQDACNQCHEEELKRVDDSHPVIKFKDPRNAERLEKLDARYCVTCHREHQPEVTNAMGVTLPEDYCFHCHQNIGEERPTHVGMSFDTCATAGCHNFHDNSALYERFLTDHLDEPDLKPVLMNFVRDHYNDHYEQKVDPLHKDEADVPEDVEHTHRILFDWSTTSHAKAGVNCKDCHEVKDPETNAGKWVDQPDHDSCRKCHDFEVKGFLEGKHGMRLAQGLSPMTPGMARLPMKKSARHKELSCISCHSSHKFNTRHAAVDACLSCHDDEHSLAYKESKHFKLFEADATAGRPGPTAVTCATCHLPRIEHSEFGETFHRVDHNQNNTLRPNDKMIRTSCIKCHGMQFTLNALADEELIKRNFNGLPEVFVDSLEMAREEKIKTEKSKK